MYTLSGLTPEKEYHFRVIAKNDIGESEPGPASDSVICKDPFGRWQKRIDSCSKTVMLIRYCLTDTISAPSLFFKDKPSQPGEIDTVIVTKDYISIRWERPECDGGKEILGYWVEYRMCGESSWKKCNTERTKDKEFTMGNLREATEYEFRVFAENETGISRPPKLGQSAILKCQIIGRPLPEIRWYRHGKELMQTEKYAMTSDGRIHTLKVLANRQEDEGIYTCKAVNEAGEVETSGSLVLEAPPQIHPEYPLKEIYYAGCGTSLRLHVVYIGRPEPKIINGHYQVIVTRSFTSLVFSNGIERKDAGFYIVCAKNRFGIDQQTVEIDVADVPDPPRGIKASDVSRDSVTLNWCAPANDGGSKVTSYIVEKCATTAEKWTRVAQSRDTRYTVINLFGKTSYQFRVIAENKFGQSEPSEPTGPVVTKEDKSRVLNYDEEVDDVREVTAAKAPHSDTKNLHNKYMIAEELGRGQFAIVHRCTEVSSEKTYMVKFVKVKGADQAVVKKEIATLNVARHRNFLCLHESFESPEELVMIYDFISGVDIFERIATPDFELTERVIVNYIKQICEALAFLHSKSYGHFDIKPENIVYTTRKSTKIKIIEMGQARHLTPGDTIKIQFTAPEYCAPEIHQHDLVSTVTDMWSVGVLAYVLLSGLNPFIAETNQQVIDNISNAEYSFDDEAFKKASLDALDFVDRLLTKDRKHRMTAAEALEHPWLKTNPEELSNTAIKTSRHKRYYQTLVKKEWNVVVSAARVASGGTIRSQRGVTVGKVKIAPFEHGPVAGQVKHNATEEGGDAKFICHIENYDSSTEVTWYCGVRQLEESDKYEISYEDGVAILSVKGVVRADDGTYRCKVVNEYGEDSAYAELFVEGSEADQKKRAEKEE
uniref:Uncharacterized protein n=1 Tax=Scleropages formosus TaxID=113540 RepID=A0A8C9VIQ7_SCLFO